MKPRIISTGWKVPDKIRTNYDPIFDWLKQNTDQDQFKGYITRHVLADGEELESLMLPAAQTALENAGLEGTDIDMIIGASSVSKWRNPSLLTLLHRELKLPPRAWAIPVDNDFTSFNSSVLFADALLRAGRAKNILICVGGNWTRNVDYHTSQAISASDGAGAAVMSLSNDKSLWTLVDSLTISATEYYGGMYTGRNQLNTPSGGPSIFSENFYHLNALGQEGFQNFGLTQPINCVNQLLENNNLVSKDITLLPNQSSSSLLEPWLSGIKPAQSIDTIETFANMTVATTAVNFGFAQENKMIEKDKVVLMGLGPDIHVNSILLERN
jgi:3-oxoacyl-[acyl-carrier-protein] synthase III